MEVNNSKAKLWQGVIFVCLVFLMFTIYFQIGKKQSAGFRKMTIEEAEDFYVVKSFEPSTLRLGATFALIVSQNGDSISLTGEYYSGGEIYLKRVASPKSRVVKDAGSKFFYVVHEGDSLMFEMF